MKSDKSFDCVFACLSTFLVLQIFLGICIIILSEYMKHSLDNHIYQIDKVQTLNIFFLIELYGLHISFYFLCGVPVIRMLSDPYTKHLAFLIKIWLILGFESSVGAFFISWFCYNANNYLNEKIEISLRDGLYLYEKVWFLVLNNENNKIKYLIQDPIWRFIWNELQYNYKCCGVNNSSDWQILVEDDQTSTLPIIIAPSSCAKQSQINPDTKGLEATVFSDGCFDVLSQNILRNSYCMITLNLLTFINHVIITFLTRMAFMVKRCYVRCYSEDDLLVQQVTNFMINRKLKIQLFYCRLKMNQMTKKCLLI